MNKIGENSHISYHAQLLSSNEDVVFVRADTGLGFVVALTGLFFMCLVDWEIMGDCFIWKRKLVLRCGRCLEM